MTNTPDMNWEITTVKTHLEMNNLIGDMASETNVAARIFLQVIEKYDMNNNKAAYYYY